MEIIDVILLVFVILLFTFYMAFLIVKINKDFKRKDPIKVKEHEDDFPETSVRVDTLPTTLFVIGGESYFKSRVDYYIILPDGRVYPKLACQISDSQLFRVDMGGKIHKIWEQDLKKIFESAKNVIEDVQLTSDSFARLEYYSLDKTRLYFVEEEDAKQYLKDKLHKQMEKSLAQYKEKLNSI